MNLEIRPGFKLYGKVNILGLEASCDIEITPPISFAITVALMPIKIGKGALILSRGRTDNTKGPLVHVGISKKTGVAVKIAAYAEILGIGTEVSIDVSSKGFSFFVHGNLFNVIEANVKVSAPYGNGKIMESAFEISSCLSTSTPKITMAAKETINDGADATKKITAEAEKEIEESGLADDSPIEKLNYWQEKIKEKEDAIKRKAGKLDKINDFLDDPCVQQCEDICVGGPSMEKTGKKLFGKISLKKPKWDPCKFKAEDVACVAECKAKKVYLQGKALKKKVTMEVLIASIKLIRKLVALFEYLVEQAQKFAEFVEDEAEKVEKAVEAGKKALEAVLKYTRENIIEIRHICFNTTLEKVKNACLGFSVEVVVGGKHEFKYDLNACLDASFITTIAKDIADKVFPGIGSIKENIRKAKEFFKNIGDKKKDLNKEEQKVEEKVKEMEGEIKEPDDSEDDDDEDRATRKGTVVLDKQIPKSKEWAYIYQQVYGSIPSVTFRDDDTIDAFSSRSPWAFSENDTPYSTEKSSDMLFQEDKTDLVTTNANERDDIIGLDDEAKKDFLTTDPGTSNAIGGNSSCPAVYSNIVNGYSELLHGFDKEIHLFHKQKRSMFHLRNETEREILRLSRKGKFSNDTEELLLQFVTQMNKENNKWAKNVRRQIDQQEEFLYKDLKKSLNDFIKQNHGVDTNTFLTQYKTNLLKDQDMVAAIPNIEALDQQVRHLLTNENNTIQGKRNMIGQLNQAIKKADVDCL